LFEQRINFCQIAKVNLVARAFIDEATKALNFEVKCPFKAGFYHQDEHDAPKKEDWQGFLPSWFKNNKTFRVTAVFRTREKYSIDVIWEGQTITTL
jgi:hypothetical protein